MKHSISLFRSQPASDRLLSIPTPNWLASMQHSTVRSVGERLSGIIAHIKDIYQNCVYCQNIVCLTTLFINTGIHQYNSDLLEGCILNTQKVLFHPRPGQYFK